MVTEISEGRSGFWREALLLTGLALVLYVFTLAPTVLWGDGGHLQLNAVEGVLQGSAGSHPLWVWIAHQFTHLPWGDIAGRVNLVSAVFGALTIGALYLLLREVGIRRVPAVLATLSLMISHTFWSHAVQAEVYTLTLSLMTLAAWLGLRWYHTGKRLYLVTLGLTLGIGLSAHLMVVLYGPALLWLLFRRRWDGRGVLGAVLAGLAGTAPLLWLLARDVSTLGLQGSGILRWALVSFEGYNFSNALFDFSLRMLPLDTFEWLAYLSLQFVGVAGLCGVWGLVKSRKMAGRDIAVYVLLLYLGALAFSFAYRVGDRYVFYLPSYLPFAVWIGFGFQWVEERWRQRSWQASTRRVSWVMLALLTVMAPLAAYRFAPELVAHGITFRDTRHVPGPDGKYFFLWPPKSGYDDPRVYAEAALTVAPPGTVLLADPILSSPIRFLQSVEQIRPDVTVRYCCWDIVCALQESQGRPVVLADADEIIYPMAWLQEQYIIQYREPVYLLLEKWPLVAEQP